MPRIPGWLEDRPPPSVLMGSLSGNSESTPEPPAGDKIAPFSLLAKAQVFQGFHHRDGKGVVNHRHINVLMGNAGHGKGRFVALLGGDIHQIPPAGPLVGNGLANAQHPYGTLAAVAGHLRRCHYHRAAAVGYHAAVGQVQRRGNHPGVHHVRHRYRVAEEGLRVQRGVLAYRYGHLGQLLRSSAVKVHVALGNHRVQADGGQAVKLLKAVRRRVQAGMPVAAHAAGADRHPAGAGQAAVGDDGAVDPPGGDGGQGVGQVKLEGTAAHRGVVHVLGVHIQVVGQVHPAVADAAGGGKEAVHVGFGQAGVRQGLDDALPLDLQFAFVRGVAGNVLVNTHNRRAALQVNHTRRLHSDRG